MPAPRGEADEFERLKTVLFSPEAARLAAAESQIEELGNWVGDAGRLEAATAEIIAGALRRAETARHRELAAAIAPVVVAAIRAEIHNSRDMMVEALYPITGRLVAAAVANAFRELLDTINQRLDQLVSTNQWRLRFRSLATGRSVAEIALAEARASGYQRIFLLERGSGRLLAMWRPGGEREDNPELVSGMVAAISEFASTVLSEHHGELRSLDLGASQVYLRASSQIILAAETLGGADRKAQKRLDGGFVDLVVRRERGDEIGESDLAELAETSAAPKAPARTSKLRGVVLALVALLALAWGLKGPVYRWRKTQEIDAAFSGALRADPKLSSYPLSLREDWSAGTVTIIGLSGSPTTAENLKSAVASAAAPLSVVSQIEVVATSAEIDSLRRSVAEQASALKSAGVEIGSLRESLTEQSDALKSAGVEIESLRRGAAEQAAALKDAGVDIAERSAKFDAELTALRQDRSELSAEVVAKMESLASAEADARKRAAEALVAEIAGGKTALASAQRRLDDMKQALADVRASLAAPRRQITEAAAATVVWFGDRDALADPLAANNSLDALSKAIKATGEGVRVVGYADESGGAQANVEISRLRAAKAVKLLVERGVPAEKLRSVGRGAQTPIADQSDNMQYPNRRVAFEPLFAQEEAR